MNGNVYCKLKYLGSVFPRERVWVRSVKCCWTPTRFFRCRGHSASSSYYCNCSSCLISPANVFLIVLLNMRGVAFSARNITVLRDTVCNMWLLFLSNEGALVENKWSSLLETNVYLQRLNGIAISVTFVLVQNCVHVKCFKYKLQPRTCFRFECKTATGSARAQNACTKRGIENSFPGIQMFVQARNKKCLQQCGCL